MPWDDDDDDWGKPLPDDPESVARRQEASRQMVTARAKVLQWVSLALGVLVVLVLVLWLAT